MSASRTRDTVIGALRGADDTHSGLITHLCCYWLIGLPLGVYLAFHRHLGARCLWLGLSVALTLAGCILLLRWRRVSQSLTLFLKGRPSSSRLRRRSQRPKANVTCSTPWSIPGFWTAAKLFEMCW